MFSCFISSSSSYNMCICAGEKKWRLLQLANMSCEILFDAQLSGEDGYMWGENKNKAYCGLHASFSCTYSNVLVLFLFLDLL